MRSSVFVHAADVARPFKSFVLEDVVYAERVCSFEDFFVRIVRDLVSPLDLADGFETPEVKGV